MTAAWSAAWLLPWMVQSTLLALLGLALLRVLMVDAPGVRLRWCQALLPVALLLPWASVVMGPASAGAVRVVDEAVLLVVPRSLADGAGAAVSWLSPWHLPALWLAGATLRVGWLGVGLGRLRGWRQRAASVEDPALTRAQVSVPVEATCLASEETRQPVTWGLRHPVLLVPASLAGRPAEQRRAVYVHELLHVARRDMRWVWAEEVLRTVLWPLPAVWLLVPAVRLAREQVIDAETVRLTRAPRAYVDVLVWCADAAGPRQVPVLPFFRRHQLLTRVASLTREVSMSRLRATTMTIGITVGLCGSAAVLAAVVPLPVHQSAALPVDAGVPGSLERVAVLPTLDAPAPRRTVAVEPDVAAILPAGTSARYRVHAVIDASGAVAEARIVTVATAGGDLVDTRALRAAVLAAVGQWQFEAPAPAPMLLVTGVTVGGLAPPSDGDAPVPVGGGVAAPQRIHNVFPVYPPVARDAKVQGVVIIEAIVERTGDVSAARVLRSIPLLDAAALDAVRQWKYEPGPHRLQMVMTINFALQADDPQP